MNESIVVIGLYIVYMIVGIGHIVLGFLKMGLKQKFKADIFMTMIFGIIFLIIGLIGLIYKIIEI